MLLNKIVGMMAIVTSRAMEDDRVVGLVPHVG
jgi:hypothetical protein